MSARHAERAGKNDQPLCIDRLEPLACVWRAQAALERIAWTSDEHEQQGIEAAYQLEAVDRLLTRMTCLLAHPRLEGGEGE
jgi:hypothetical protein